MDPQSSPGRLTCHPLLYGLQIQTREQHLGLETPGGRQREREEKGSERKAFIQLWNKQKSQHSAVASPWVKQRLHDWILKKPHQAAAASSSPSLNFRVLSPFPDLDFHQRHQCSTVSPIHSNKQLRRTASEPIQKLKAKRSMNTRKNPLCHKSSAPSTGNLPSYHTHGPCSRSSNTTLSQHNSHRGSQLCDYKTRLMSCQSHESPRSLSSFMWGNVCMSSPPTVSTSPGQEVGAGAASSTRLSVNVTNHPSPVPSHPRAAPSVHVDVRHHKLVCRTQSLHVCHVCHVCHSCRHNSSERTQRSSHKHEPGVFHVSPGTQHMEGEGLVRGRSRLSEGDRSGWTSSRSPEQPLGGNCSQCSLDQELASLPRASPTRKLTKTRSFPLFQPHITHPASMKSLHTGFVCNSEMLKALYVCAESCTPREHAGIQRVLSRLQECGLRNQCLWVRGRQATLEELRVVQPESHIHPYGTNRLGRLHLAAARMAAGSVTELALRVAQGELRNGFAILEPHEHDASLSSNTKPVSVAIAAKQLQCRLNVSKILIVNWDVHHGNIIQEVFYTDPNVLYISLHRHGCDSPNWETGGPNEVGSGTGEGFNVNVAWSGDLDCLLGDAEYLAAFRTVVMPIASEFSPDVVLVSSEFSAVEGHPGSSRGYNVSAKCFGLLTRQLMEVAQGHVVLALEGGLDLKVICDASEACLNALLDNEVATLSEGAVMNRPCAKAMQSLQRVLQIQSKYWWSVRAVANTLVQSACPADTEATSALASLSMAGISNQDSDGLFWSCHDQNEPIEHDENI
ncbi:histone deacetylase 7 isoform X2 [Brachyhypopomus gauderio]|uniref:histone deacetylase 7 isoform X2 n=1 Tax=Brachyhypopomus gauderio TaxID=698409 RepID=UPI0040432FB7